MDDKQTLYRKNGAGILAQLPDADLLAAYQRTDGEPGNPEADALAEELRRRNIDF